MKLKKNIPLLIILSIIIFLFSIGLVFVPTSNATVEVYFWDFGDAYTSQIRMQIDKRLKEAGIDYKISDAQLNQDKQTAQVDRAIANGVKLLLVSPVDQSASENLLNRARDAGIPIIFFNRQDARLDYSQYDKAMYVGSDLDGGGRMQGEEAVNLLTDLNSPFYIEKQEGANRILNVATLHGQKGHADATYRTVTSIPKANELLKNMNYGLQLKGVAEGDDLTYASDTWSVADGAANMDLIINQRKIDIPKNAVNNGNIGLVFSNNDSMALGALQTLQNFGWNKGDASKTLPLLGVDALPLAQQNVKDGYMAATFLQDGANMGDMVVDSGLNAMKGLDLLFGTTYKQDEIDAGKEWSDEFWNDVDLDVGIPSINYTKQRHVLRMHYFPITAGD